MTAAFDRFTTGIPEARRAALGLNSPSARGCLDDAAIRAALRDPRTAEEVEQAISAVADRLGERRDLALGLLLGADPQFVLPAPDGTEEPVKRWIDLARITEAVWQLINRPVPMPFPVSEAEMLRPLAARLRFLVLSEPSRYRGLEFAAWLAEPDASVYPEGGLHLLYGPDSWPILIARAQHARHEWLTYLDGYQSLPLLAEASAAQLEQELQALLFAAPGHPLVLSARPPEEVVSPTPDDRAVAADLVDRHLLPRFALLGPLALALHDTRRPWRWARRALAAVTAAAGVAAVVLTALLHPGLGAAVAGTMYVLIGLGVLAIGPEWAAPWLLRLPAAGSVGAFLLVSLHPNWWQGIETVSAPVTGGLVLAAYGYLLIEARNHGIAAGAALARALGVLAIGALHALLVAVVTLAVLVPAFAEAGRTLGEIWTQPARAIGILATATAWCLAVGVFSQILWDDRPITAPLAHLSWRTGGQR